MDSDRDCRIDAQSQVSDGILELMFIGNANAAHKKS